MTHTVTSWPNNLGFDVTLNGETFEVFKHRNGLRVFGDEKCGFVYTDNPVDAVVSTANRGLIRGQLDEMDPRDAQALFLEHFKTEEAAVAA